MAPTAASGSLLTLAQENPTVSFGLVVPIRPAIATVSNQIHTVSLMKATGRFIKVMARLHLPHSAITTVVVSRYGEPLWWDFTQTLAPPPPR